MPVKSLPLDMTMETECIRRGVKTRLIGFTIVILGLLDSLLTLRGGIPDYKYLILILFGACIFAIGAVRGGQKPGEIKS